MDAHDLLERFVRGAAEPALRRMQEQEQRLSPWQQLRQQQQMQVQSDPLADPAEETAETATSWLASNVEDFKGDDGRKALGEKKPDELIALAKTARAQARSKRDNPYEVPEKFLKDGKPDYSAVVGSYKSLEQAQFRRREEIKKEIADELAKQIPEGVPAAPGDYTVPKMKLEDGREVTIQNDHPMFQWFAAEAHRMKMPQKDFDRLLGDYMKLEVARGPNWSKEAEALGEHAEGRLDRVDAWAQRSMPDEFYQVFNKLPASAAMVKMWEHIMTLSGEPAFAVDSGGQIDSGPLTREKLKEMQRDPKYWRDSDPQFIAQVKAGFRKLATQKTR